MITQEETSVQTQDTTQLLTRITLPPLAWYGGSWAYEEPDPEPTPEPVAPPPEKWEQQTIGPESFGPDMRPGRGQGVILGRFLPPHAGHEYVVDFARRFTKQLTLFLRVGPEDTIAGELREAWLREMFPDVKVVRVDDAPPLNDAEEQNAARERWAWFVRQSVAQPDYLFASESYGAELAVRLGARYVPVDPARRVVPVSGEQIRGNPAAYWAYLPACVRPHYVRRVCLIGPEATGKTTLAGRLAARFNTLCTEEYARTWSSQARNFEWQPADTQIIAQGQRALTAVMAQRAYRVLFCDTDLLAVRLWCERIFGSVPEWLQELAQQEVCDLYLVTRPDVPYNGPARFDQPAQRQAFYERIVRELTERKLPFREISGDWETRFEQAHHAVETLLL